MGRELKRVPLNFDWPLKKTWEGFLNPHWKPCPADNVDCFGGATAAGKWLDAVARLVTLLGEDAMANAPRAQAHFRRTGRIYPHPYLQEWTQAPRHEMPRDVHDKLRAIENQAQRMRALHQYYDAHPARVLPLTPELLALVQGLCGGRLDPMGGGSASYALSRKFVALAGLDEERWGVCTVCRGEGMDPAVKEIYEAWQRTGPPAGDGWQVWETVSEGSPVSPVFATAVGLARWLVDHEGWSERGAAHFVGEDGGWMPSGVGTPGDMHFGCDVADFMAADRASTSPQRSTSRPPK